MRIRDLEPGPDGVFPPHALDNAPPAKNAELDRPLFPEGYMTGTLVSLPQRSDQSADINWDHTGLWLLHFRH